MALVGRTQLGLKPTGTTTTVPENPKAKLMYYLNCMAYVLNLDNEDVDIARLKDYQNNYLRLTDQETDLLIMLCGVVLKPDVLLNKCIFQSDALCGNACGKFYELEAVSDRLLVAGSVMVGGRTKRVSKILAFKVTVRTAFIASRMIKRI